MCGWVGVHASFGSQLASLGLLYPLAEWSLVSPSSLCCPWQVCGQNPAYDFFPSQHQIFYRGRGKNEMWYDPVFKVVTISGEKVNLWRRACSTVVRVGLFPARVVNLHRKAQV